MKKELLKRLVKECLREVEQSNPFAHPSSTEIKPTDKKDDKKGKEDTSDLRTKLPKALKSWFSFGVNPVLKGQDFHFSNIDDYNELRRINGYSHERAVFSVINNIFDKAKEHGIQL